MLELVGTSKETEPTVWFDRSYIPLSVEWPRAAPGGLSQLARGGAIGMFKVATCSQSCSSARPD